MKRGAVLLLCVVGMAVLAGCDASPAESRAKAAKPRDADGATPTVAPTNPPSRPAEDEPVEPGVVTSSDVGAETTLVNVTLPPVATFADKCARCHGPEGAFYGKEFSHLTPAKLTIKVDEMMRGPGFLKPTDADIAAMTAYHWSLRLKEPFVVVLNGASATASDPDSLKLEASPNTAVEVSVMPGGVQVTATRGEQRSAIVFPEQQWSHGE